jgi:predicted acylesterase/phospholipase RssA
MIKAESNDIKRAKGILRGANIKSTPDELLTLAKSLKKENAFSYARQILARARRDPAVNKDAELRLNIIQQRALCTYKDNDLPADSRLTRALEILEETGDLLHTTNQETLGIAGGIYKRKWEVDGQKSNLERSFSYYYRGHQQDIVSNQGYTGINAAYVLDLMAQQEMEEARKAGAVSETARARQEQAGKIRQSIVDELTAALKANKLKENWWTLATLAEAHFGLGQYEEAGPWLKKAAGLLEQGKVEKWEQETTARQLSNIARLRHASATGSSRFEDSTAWQVLRDFIGSNTGVRTASIGKVGLALSGGGFRASLFHIGVLARLAELDVLRHVEVISGVSGGSIIGAHYYLEVRHLLQTKPDAQITRQDYIEIVQRIERDFLAGVQRNIRMRVIANLWKNIKMALPWLTYNRSERVGELYESELYARVQDGVGKKEPRWLNKLFIKPEGEKDSFKPKYDNWRREAKVPILILNATTLNTGHNWQFTASWMGEPPAGIDTEIDGSDRLRRMYYEEAPERHRRVRLGHAVAASACVPGLFEPLMLADLFPDRVVRLVDGGVQDNQGVTGLLEQDCTVMLVSDASGQMASEHDSKSGLLGGFLGGALAVLLRTKDILMARVREAEYHELDARRRSSLLRGLMFLHLTKDLDVDPIDWVCCQDPYDASDESRPIERRGRLTRYGIQKEAQQRLAAIRTDLDSFSDTEAYALMTSGYRMTEYEFADCLKDFPVSRESNPNWLFLAIEEQMQVGGCETKQKQLMRLLDVASTMAFKIWKLSLALKVFAALLLLAALGVLGWLGWTVWNTPALWQRPLLTLGAVVSMILTIIITMVATSIFGKTVVSLVKYRKTSRTILIGLAASVFGWLIAYLHIYTFDKWFLAKGRINRKTDVFFCYASKDQDAVSVFDEGLRQTGRTTSIDGKDTLFKEERADEINSRIEAASTFVFVTSPDSVEAKSPCRKLLDHAIKSRKRLVQIQRRDIDGASLPSSLASTDAIRFHDGDEIDKAFQSLLKELDTAKN